VALYEVEEIDAAIGINLFCGFLFGPYSNLAAIQEKAAAENGRQVELIKMLNKEN
jgi:hypothetical protein